MNKRPSQLNVLGESPARAPGEQVKASRFNVYRTLGSKTAVFNTLSGKWAVLGAMPAHFLKSGKPQLLAERDLERLMAIDALVATELDEHSLYRYLHQKAVHDTRTLSVVVGLTFHCNLACPYCFEEGADLERMSEETLDRIILAIQRKCLADSTKELRVMLFGGEPLLEVDKGHTLLSQLSSWAARNGIKFEGSMATNATLASRER
ncbi:MAG TPA: 4Fe-4S cluster-binding domain-containing protein, partial [Kofleriaceae bacterium]|nr:4Fe-4S cluster-binding domain-containing protein [Kofleriaceae bacterium]